MKLKTEWSVAINTCFQPEKIFLFFAIIIGLMWTFITPPFQAPDEFVHFYKAYSISDGHLFAKKYGNKVGDFLPSSIAETADHVNPGLRFHSQRRQNPKKVKKYLTIGLDKEKKQFVEFPTSAIYTPIGYLPSTGAIIIGKIVDASPLILMYMARLANLIFWILFGYLAISRLPGSKWLFLFLALMPMNIFLAPTLNQDAVLIPLSMFFIASILYLAKTPEATLTLKWLAALWVISLLLTLGKPVYLLLTILFLLIPKSKMKNRFFYYGFLVLMIFTGISVTVLWNWLVKDLTVNFQPWSSPVDQLNVILKNPLNYLIVNLRTYWTFKGLYLFSHIGQLGWLDVVLPPKVIFTYLGAIFFAEIVNNGMNIKASEKLLFFGIFIASILLTSFALYLIWSPVGDPYIHGIQGRYFIPFVPLFWMIFHNNFKVRTSAVPFLKIIVFLYLMIIFYTVTNRLLDRYYLSP